MIATITPAHEDAIVANMIKRLKPAAREAILQDMTPRDRRQTEAAAARYALRQRTRAAWSTQRVTRLTVSDTNVTIYPGDHGGWTVCAEAAGMVFATDGTWADENTATEDETVWATQADVIEALAATI